jgi:hypothetical protein
MIAVTDRAACHQAARSGGRRRVQVRPGDVVEVILKEAERHVGDAFADFPVSVAGAAELFHAFIGHGAWVRSELPLPLRRREPQNPYLDH